MSSSSQNPQPPSSNPDRIREIRNRLGLTQERFAQRLGVSFVTVSRWERGKSKPIPAFRKQIEAMLDVFPGAK